MHIHIHIHIRNGIHKHIETHLTRCISSLITVGEHILEAQLVLMTHLRKFSVLQFC
jgi:hypothetical protein